MARLRTVQKFRGTSKTEDGNLRCGSCGKPITPGMSYRWFAKRSPGARSGFRRNFHTDAECMPKPWEYQTSSPHIAAMMQAEHFGNEAVADAVLDPKAPEDFIQALKDACNTAAEYVREAQEGYREAAEAIEEGFQHATYQSDELNEKADQYESQADELESWEPGNEDPPERDEDDEDMDDEAWESELENWAEEARSEAESAIEEGTQQY